MNFVATAFLAALGMTCIYAGYRLFCGLPALAEQRSASRATLLMLNILPGALLGLIGMALLTTTARAMMPAHHATHRQHELAPQGTSWHPQTAPGLTNRAA